MGALFDKLTAFSTLVRAFDRVEENRGGPGVDGETVDDYGLRLEENLAALREELVSGRYRPRPLLRVEIEKADGKRRPLSIPTVRDRIAQTAAAMVLTPVLEPEFEDASFAYREGRSVDQAVRRIIDLRDRGYQWVVDADIRSYFDEIPHDKLFAVLARYVDDDRILELVRLWLQAEVRERNTSFRLSKGVPQGSPLSPLLANLYLDRLDEAFLHRGHKLVRFADDFVVLCKDRPQAEAALEMSEEVLGRLRLTLNPEKTRITHFNHGFRYLGVQFLRSLAFRPEHPDQDLHRPPVSPASPTPASDPLPLQDTALAEAMREALAEHPPDAAKKIWEELQEGSREEDLPPPSSGHDPVLRTLYVMEQGAELAKEDERLIVRKDGATLREVPAMKVDQVMIFGNVRITTPAMQFCLMEDIPVFLLSSRGRYYGAIESTTTDKVVLHRDQFTRAGDPAFVLNLSREIVRGKVANTRTLLLRSARKNGSDDVRSAATALQGVLNRLDAVSTLDELRGMEGSAAARYFSVWPELVGGEWRFEGRRRQPPPDPVNSLLSFGYTLLFYNTYSMVRSRGLHPHVGFYHTLRQGHPSLVSDLMEEFRAPVVDATVLTLLHRRQVTPEDFRRPTDPETPCLLTDEARKRVTRTFEAAFNRSVSHPDTGRCDYRRAIALQAQRLVDAIRDGRSRYQAFQTR
jgi:CRISPR-associated protein Cas1